MKIKLSKREVLLVSILAAAALIYAYLTYFIFPAYTRTAELESELLAKRKIAVDREEAEKKLSFLDAYFEKSKQELENMEKKIPYNVKLPELLVNIDSSISALDMDIQSISVGEPDTANKEYDIVPINVSLIGKYDGIMEFIKYFEDNDRKFIIDSFNLTPVRRNEAIPFDIELRTFVLKDEAKGTVPEPEDYYFFKHENGKSYPFLENIKKVEAVQEDIIEEVEEMEKKYEKLDDIINGMKGLLPSNIGSEGEN